MRRISRMLAIRFAKGSSTPTPEQVKQLASQYVEALDELARLKS